MQLPDEVLAFLRDAGPLRDRRLRINPLTAEQCAVRTEALREIPVVAALGLIALDDADDSNPFCLITSGPASGMVVHFFHDPEPELCYSSLRQFLDALRVAHRDRLTIDDLPRPVLDPHPDQALLTTFLQAWLHGDHDDAVIALQIHYPLLERANLDVLRDTASHVDPLIREIAARFIERHADPAHRAIATRLASDPYPQVAVPARRALGVMAARER